MLVCSFFLEYFVLNIFWLWYKILFVVFIDGINLIILFKVLMYVDLLYLEGLIIVVILFFNIFKLMFCNVWFFLYYKFRFWVE